ncbi:MAG: hypothetical protein JNK45_02870, partial [Myxococcales bacterium]|nr:hypothetical protein [Myxococcales bacterium]
MNRGTARWVFALLAGATGCDRLTGGGEAEPAAAKADTEAKAADVETKAPDPDAKADAKADTVVPPASTTACPDGGTAKGAAPPAGSELWCELVEGGSPVRHGRWTRWYDGSTQKWHEQEYRRGKRHGRETSWFDNGKLSAEGDN